MADDETHFPSIGDLAAVSTKETSADDKDPVSADLVNINENDVVQQVESLCMSCGLQGITKLLLTSIPYFREVIVMSFLCDHCGASNNEIQSAEEIQSEGIFYTARILTRSDLNRQIVRSSTCSVAIAEFALTLPANKRGHLTNVEGLIRGIVSDLSMDQPLRKIQDQASYLVIESLLVKLRTLFEEGDELENPSSVIKAADNGLLVEAFTLQLDDPAGNSWIEFFENISDPKWSMRTYRRTLEQNILLGLVATQEEPLTGTKGDEETSSVKGVAVDDEILVFHGSCSSCGHPLDTMMKKVLIPYFKDILIMSANCDQCGYRDNEVKSGTAISEQGKRITLKVEDLEDLSRDILKSETAGLSIPEIDLTLTHGTLGGRFTTLEGILHQVYDGLVDKAFAGDSSTGQDMQSIEIFLQKLKEIKVVGRPFTVILDDPLANSYVQNLCAPDSDPNLVIEMYERTWEQNEELGLNDMKVEHYSAPLRDRSESPGAPEVQLNPP